MAREIDLSSDLLLSRHGGVLDVLRVLSRKVPEPDWCIIGGLMTFLGLREQSSGTDARASQTKDADVVVEVATGSARRVIHELSTMGFDQIEMFFGQSEAQARYSMGHTLIDVLAPDDGEPADLNLDGDTVTLAAPGGRRALQVSTVATVYYGAEGVAELRLPTIGHAVVVKSAAVLDQRTEGQPRHLEDVIELLGAIDDPDAWVGGMNESDLDLLERVLPRVAAAGDLEAIAALQLLLRAIGEQKSLG